MESILPIAGSYCLKSLHKNSFYGIAFDLTSYGFGCSVFKSCRSELLCNCVLHWVISYSLKIASIVDLAKNNLPLNSKSNMVVDFDSKQIAEQEFFKDNYIEPTVEFERVIDKTITVR